MILWIRDDKFLNIKLFKNGSIQMTGCKLLSDANLAINKLIMRLREKIVIRKNNIYEGITFVENSNNLVMSKFKIDLINSNFGVTYSINKELLYDVLINKNILCRLTPDHSCVNVKYKIKDEEDIYVSIFIFQTGNIIITGAKKSQHIRETYIFIVRFLNEHKQKIIKKDISKYLDIFKDDTNI
jgi:TATA-box binding protein (TBP) (component of TFIID and TFIIIB)